MLATQLLLLRMCLSRPEKPCALSKYLGCCISHSTLVFHCRYVLRITTHGKAKVPLNPQRIVSSLLNAKPVAQSASGSLAQTAV